MKEEVLYGFIAAIAWSLYVIVLKAVLKSASLKEVLIFLSLGILISALFFSLLIKGNFSLNLNEILLSLLAGFLWFLGIFVVNYGLKKGLNLSIMAPIYNINTVLVVLLSLAIFHESVEPWKVIIASILVTIAAIILS